MYVFKNNHFYSFLHRRSRSRVTYILNKNLSLQYDVSHETYRNNKADSHVTSIHLTFTHRLVHRNRDRRRRLRALRSPRRPCLESAQPSVFLREERK